MSQKNSEEINEKLKELIIARIEANMSSNLKLSIGANGSMNKEQMIRHVADNDEIGRRIIQTHLNFMRAQATGQLTNALNEV